MSVKLGRWLLHYTPRVLHTTCHKTHTVCLLANARIRNRWINNELLHVRIFFVCLPKRSSPTRSQ
ncbi:hypothetical protein EDC04DRAFT_2781967 [Pisolithus marmoratus]|nr:hypothetical protein EDC04DRAFT_2781967 [Pisolithus marmoratus]